MGHPVCTYFLLYSVCKVWVEISITLLWCILWAESWGAPCLALLFISVMETHNGNTSGQRSAQLIFSSPAQPRLQSSAADDPSVSQLVFTIMSTRALSWLKVHNSAFTFKTLLRNYAKRALTPQSLNVKLGPRRAAIRHYANQPARPWWLFCQRPNFTLRDCGVSAC